MFRALSTRRSGCSGGGGGSGDGGYERLADESSVGLTEAKLKRVTSLPVKLFGSSSRKLTPDQLNSPAKQAKKVSKIHPLFGLFDMRRRKKNATAKPEVARYMEYVKEGGIWDVNSNMPVIYYK